MACVRIQNGFICRCNYHKLRLQDGNRVFMHWHCYLGPVFYKDKDMVRQIDDWDERPLIVNAFNWFLNRGERS